MVNKPISADFLCAGSEQERLCWQANDPSTAAEILLKLLQSGDPWVRGAAVLNCCTPSEGIDALEEEPNAHVATCLHQRSEGKTLAFSKPHRVRGQSLILRNTVADDADFIVQLRTDVHKSRHISQTSPNVQAQRGWLERYSHDTEQVYFIIENQSGEPLGTVRLYDQQGDSFCWGSWVIKDGCPAAVAIESALIVYRFGFVLGFRNAHFDVRKANTSVWRFHERFGAVRTGESELDYFYRISATSIADSLVKYAKYLPTGILVE